MRRTWPLVLAALVASSPWVVTRLAAQEGRDPLRAEFWMELADPPGLSASSPAVVDNAATRLVEEAAFVFSGQLWGFSFDWTPSDRARKIAESFDLLSARKIERGDPRLIPEASRVEEGRLLAYVSWRASPGELALLASYAREPWKNAQGLGRGDYGRGLEGRRLAYEEAARAAIRELLRSLEPNKPRRVRGRLVLSAVPRIAVVDGAYLVQARFRIEVTEIYRYEVF
jgi:hypothetical protein